MAETFFNKNLNGLNRELLEQLRLKLLRISFF